MDIDGDGFSGDTKTQACQQPSNGSLNNDDCDDDDIISFPGADEICDGKDNDCNGTEDDNPIDPLTFYFDKDSDGFGTNLDIVQDCVSPAGYADNPNDCNDDDVSINPDASELCDSIDNDCDSLIDDDDDSIDSSSQTPFALDVDEDGFGDSDNVILACEAPSLDHLTDVSDCDDDDPDINPLGTEICDGIDQDCDGVLDSQAVCPCTFQTFSDHSYLFCDNVTLQWQWAEFVCDSRGYNLATINSEEENLFVYSTAIVLNAGQWWVGLNDRDQEGVYTWSSGESVNYLNWGIGEPENAEDDDCVELNAFGNETWNEVSCTENLRYICEVSP